MKWWRRIIEKLKLRVWLAALILFTFEDTVPRSKVKVSFAQNGEDLIVWNLFNNLGIARPTYLDIGAHHPRYLNNTALFYLLGSSGMNIEPDPALFRPFVHERPRDINLNIGIAAANGLLTFYRMADPTLSTFSAAEAQRLCKEYGIPIASEIEVPVRTISKILSEHNFRPDFLSIDVEGQELEILRDYDFTHNRPAVICAESLSFSTKGNGTKNHALCAYITSKGYRVHVDTVINTLFVDVNLFGN